MALPGVKNEAELAAALQVRFADALHDRSRQRMHRIDRRDHARRRVAGNSGQSHCDAGECRQSGTYHLDTYHLATHC